MDKESLPSAALAIPSKRDLEIFAEIEDKTTAARIIEILIKGTFEQKIIWFRDAPYYFATYIPLLAVAFRLALPNPFRIGDEPSGDRAEYLDVVFMDNKEKRLLGSAYPNLHTLASVVYKSFAEPHQRDRDERLEWLEQALQKFLPHVVSADPRFPG